VVVETEMMCKRRTVSGEASALARRPAVANDSVNEKERSEKKKKTQETDRVPRCSFAVHRPTTLAISAKPA
jgi:hypothetical protein